MGLVTEIIPSKDERVRRVKIFYRTQETGSKQEVERAVQRLIVIVPVEEKHCGGGVFCVFMSSIHTQKIKIQQQPIDA